VAFDALSTPVVLDGLVSDETLGQLLGLQTEYPELDYKRFIDLSTTEGKVELAKDVGAMQVRGGYIVVGVDGHGVPSGALDESDRGLFDESRLAPMLLRWLPEPLAIRSRVTERDGHVVAVIYVGPHPAGCAFFIRDGTYMRGTQEVVAFRARDAFWRDGTRSVRMTQHGFEQVVRRRVAAEREAWLAEQEELRRRERAEIRAAYETQAQSEAPLGALTFGADIAALQTTVLELLRRDDGVALRYLLNDSVVRARHRIEDDDIETGLGDVLDKLACVAATFLEYERDDWFAKTIAVLTQIYSMPLGEHDAERFGYLANIHPGETAPRVWLRIMERLYGVGALAVRRERWAAIRTLTLQHPSRLTDYDPNWLRHALTMASRAQHLEEQREDGRVQLSLLALVRAQVARLDCLRPDGVAPDDEEVTTSLVQFDVLSNVVAIDGADSTEGRVFYPNFARFRQTRIQGIVERLLTDSEMRAALFRHEDRALASALAVIGQRARQEGFRFDGFDGWEHTAVGAFITEQLAPEP
jgi:hypothetical protein